MVNALNASRAVQGFWTELVRGASEKGGALQLPGGAQKSVQQIIASAKTHFKLGEELTNEDVLSKIQGYLTMASALPSARAAVLGIATVLGDLGVVGAMGAEDTDKELMRTARKVKAKVFLAMTQGWFKSKLMKFQNSLSERFINAGIFPPKYRQAIERARAATEKASKKGSPAASSEGRQVGACALVLHNLLHDFVNNPGNTQAQREQGSLLDRACTAFLDAINGTIPHFQEAIELEERANKVFQSVASISEQEQIDSKLIERYIKELRELEPEVSKNVKRGLLPPSFLTRIRIDLAYCLARQQSTKGSQRGIDSQIQKLLASVKNTLPSQTWTQLTSQYLDASQRVNVIKEARKLVHNSARNFEEYDEAVSLLDDLRTEKKKKEDLSEREKGLLRNFMQYARGNKELNDYLWGKGELSPIEELICSFTYVTREIIQPDASLDRVSDKLQTLGITDFRNTCWKLDEYISENQGHHEGTLYDQLTAIKEKVAAADKADFNKNYAILFPLTEEAPSLQAKGDARFSPEHAAAVQWMKDYLTRVTTTQAPPQKGKKKASHPSEDLTNALQDISEYSELLQTATEQRNALIERAEGSGAAVRVGDMRVVDQYSNVHQLLELLPEEEEGEGGPIGQLKKAAKQASGIADQLDFSMQMLPSYEPGAILFDHEKKMKTFKQKGESPRIYSEMGKSKLWEVVKDAMKKGVFAVQPYFTGALTHAAVFLSLPDSDGTRLFTRGEVTTPCELTPVNMIESIWTVALNPNFDKMLSPEAHEKLKEKWGTGYKTELARRYSDHLTKFFQAHQQELTEKVENDPYKAAQAFINELRPEVQPIINSFVASFTPQKKAENLKGLGEPFSTGMFCSEFAGAVMTEVLRGLELKLRKETGLASVFREEAFIRPEELATLHPNKLAERIGEFYTRSKRPVITRLLLGQE
jgi:hypothetical protein